MSMFANGLLSEHCKIVMGAPPAASSTSDYVSLKNFGGMTAILLLDNATTVTASTITINQATAVAGTGAKVISRGKAANMYQNIDTGAADMLAEVAVTSGTFDTDTTNAKNLLYVIEIDAQDLDVANGFDCVQIANASGANTVIGIVYIMWPSRYASAVADQPVAITD